MDGVDADFNVGYGCVGGEGRGWRVHAGFIAGCCVAGEGGGGVAGSCWLQCRLWLCRRGGKGVAGSWLVHCRLRLSREGEDGVFLLDSL